MSTKNNEFKSLKQDDCYIGICIYNIITPDGNSFELIPEKDPLPEFDLFNNRPMTDVVFVGYYKRIIPIFKHEISDDNYVLCFADIITGEKISVQVFDVRSLSHENFNSYQNYNLQYRLDLSLKRLEQKVNKYDEDQRFNKILDSAVIKLESLAKIMESLLNVQNKNYIIINNYII